MCSFMEFASMSVPYAALREVTCRATVPRNSAGGTVAFFIVTRSSTTSRHAHKDVTHAVQYPLSSEGSAEKKQGPRPKQPLAPRPKQLVAPSN